MPHPGAALRGRASAVFIDDVAANAAAAEALGVRGIHFRSPHQLRLELAAVGILPES